MQRAVITNREIDSGRLYFCFGPLSMLTAEECRCQCAARDLVDLQAYASREACASRPGAHASAQISARHLCVSALCFIPLFDEQTGTKTNQFPV